MLLKNSFEGGSDETAITVANSGGASGNPFTDVSIGASAVFAYDTAQAMHGGYSARHQTGGTTVTNLLLWDATAIGNVARVWGRFYLRLTTRGAARSLARVRTGTTQIMRIQMAGGGAVEMRQSNNNTVATSTDLLAVDTWYRIEYDVRPGTSQTNTVRVYVGDSTTPYFELTGTGDFSANTTVNEVSFGNPGAASNLTTAWYDDVAASDTGWIGPEVAVVTPVADWTQSNTTASGSTTVGKTVTGVAAGTVLVAFGMRQSNGGALHNITFSNTGPAALNWVTPANGEWGKHISSSAQTAPVKVAYAVVSTPGDYQVICSDSGASAVNGPILRVVPVTGVGHENFIVCARGNSTGALSVPITPLLAGSLILVGTNDDNQAGVATYGAGWTRQSGTGVATIDVTFGNQTVPPVDTSAQTFTTTAPTTGTAYNAVMIALPPPGGAAQLSRTVAETVTAGESASRATAGARGTAAAATVTDSVTAVVGRSRTASDSVAAADAAVQRLGRTRGIADAVTAADSVSRAVARSRTVADAAVVADAANRIIGRAAAAADAVSAAESAATTKAAARSVSEAVTSGDAARQNTTRARPAADSVNATISAAARLVFSRGSADAVVLASAAVRALGAIAAAPGTVTAASSAARTVTVSDHAEDTVTVVSAAAGGQAVSASAADTVHAAGTVTRQFSGFRSIGDAVQAYALDLLGAATVVGARAVGESVTVADEARGGRTLSAAAADAVVLTAVTGMVFDHAATAFDQVTLEASAAKGRDVSREPAESVSVSDAVSRDLVAAFVAADAVHVAAVAARMFAYARGLTDQVHVDAAASWVEGFPPVLIIASPHGVSMTSVPASARVTSTSAGVRRTI